ncbi:DUF4435 domain-containing protein [Achromobacter dolens]|jgi:hypothetical protein|uniref:DUF4435 domain-containing protein n=1 Tax=Achromobacter dolens TaxID=1287738 RepID=UPI00355913B7
MLERTEAAKYAMTVFHENYNDFDVYIEDTAPGYQKIFASLLNRAMGSNVTIERVFPLGSRNTVIETAARELMGEVARRPAVYLVDGDLYLLAGEIQDLPNNVVVLPRYCVENFLIEENALALIMDDEVPADTIEKLRNQFDYHGWLSRAETPLRELFIVFAIAHKLKSGIQTVCRGYASICADETGEIDQDKVWAICSEITELLTSQFGENNVSQARSEVESAINRSKCFVSTYVSAKDYSLPLLLTRLRSVTKTKAPNVNLKMRFSRICSTDPLREVVDAIKKIVNPPTQELSA